MTVTFLIKLLLILVLSLIWVGRENEFAYLILLLDPLSLACHWVWYERMTCSLFPANRRFLKVREVILHCWFPANRRFLKVRESYFASLILSKWEFRKEYVQTIKCLLQEFSVHGRKANWFWQPISGLL